MKKQQTKRITKNIRPLLALLIMAFAGGIAWHHTVSATTESSGATTEKQQLAQVQTRASSEIERRITSLNALTPLVTQLSHPTKAQQKSYNKAVAAEVKLLNGYSAAINADATLGAATADAKKLTPEYTAFMVLVPKTWLIITADWQQSLEAKFATYSNKIQDRLNAANNAGKDISSAQVTLNDLQSHVNSAEQLTDDVAKNVPATQLGQYNANHAVLVSHYNHLVTARDNLSVALDDARTLQTDVAGM